MTAIEILRDKANSLPETPGVYIMRDADGTIIYVGKSKKLKNRVTSYFSGTLFSYCRRRCHRHKKNGTYKVMKFTA